MIDWNEIAFHLAKLRLSHPEILDKELPAIIRRARMRLVVSNEQTRQKTPASHTRYIMSTSSAKKAGKAEKG